MNYGLALATFHLAAGGLILILGLALLRENPRHRLNRIVALMLFLAGLGTTLGSSSFLLPHINPKAGQQGNLLTEFSYLWEFFFPTLLLFMLSFPTKHPVLKRLPFLSVLLFIPHFVHLLLVTAHALLGDTFGFPTQPGSSIVWTIPRLFIQALYGFHRALFSLVNLAYIVASLFLVRDALARTSRAQLQSQIRTIGWGMGICVLLYVVSTPFMNLIAPAAPAVLRQTLLLLALVVGCGSIAVAMVRHRFLEVSLIVRRAILYATSTAIIVGLYLTVVLEVDQLLRRVTGFDTPVFQGVFLVVSLILYQPMLSKMEEMLEGLLLKDPTDHRTALKQLSESIVTKLDLADLAKMVVTSISSCLLTNQVAFIHCARGDDRPNLLGCAGLGVTEAEFVEEIPPLQELQEMEHLHPCRLESGRYHVMPLKHEDVLLGALFFGPKITGRSYSGEDRSLLASMANQVSMALKNAELHNEAMKRAQTERDLETARRIQRSFLPTSFPAPSGADIYGHNVPSREVGGDYYDVLDQGENGLILAVADVSGKGVPGALLASMLQASLRTQVATETRVGKIMATLNRLVCDSTTDDQFATFFLAHIDFTSMRVTYANAGHNFPILLRRNGAAAFLEHSDLLLGFVPSVEYKEVATDLLPGDNLVLFTDGISEAKVNDTTADADGLLGEDGLVELLQKLRHRPTAEDLVVGVQSELDSIVRRDDEADDMTLLVMRVSSEGAVALSGRPD